MIRSEYLDSTVNILTEQFGLSTEDALVHIKQIEYIREMENIETTGLCNSLGIKFKPRDIKKDKEIQKESMRKFLNEK